MANKNLPTHDFAPAWLKIPTYDNYKPSGASSERGGHTSRRDEHSSLFTRHKDHDTLASHYSYSNDFRKDDFEDCHSSSYYGIDNGFNGSSAHPTVLSRRPHSRHDFRISVAYPKADPVAKHMTNYGQKGKGSKFHDSNNGISEGRGMGVTSNNFNQEFPSLQGDLSAEPTTPPPALNGSAWEKPRNIQSSVLGKKTQLIKMKGEESTRKSPSLIIAPKAHLKPLLPAKKEGIKLVNKKSCMPTHSMEILVKHPKAPGNKSDFLKALRNEKKEEKADGKGNGSVHREEVNGVDLSKLSFEEDKEKTILSSSLEAEEKLLREMGWKEEVSDDENYAPLTEDELKEFRDRSQKLVRNNGFRRHLVANLSPLRLALPPSESSTSSDSE